MGWYLNGSFALGGGDVHSDVDFIVAIARPLDAEREGALRALHDELPTREGHWPHDLEGSYAPVEDLRTLDALGADWLYVDRGHREMQWSWHCNRVEHRWTLREHGIALAGPSPPTFVAEVPAGLLRARMRDEIADFLPGLESWTTLDIPWSQRYAVASMCRMLYTLEHGTVVTKARALDWAGATFASEWRTLIREARERGWSPEERTTPERVAATRAFIAYGQALAAP